MNNTTQHKILLAEDDTDDCIFFKEILDELPISTELHTVNNGIDLMNHLFNNINQLPSTLFLDLNMPLKNGSECLNEIKSNETLKRIPVVIMSTSLHSEVVDLLHKNGADYYICKPGNYSNLKKIILKAITKTLQISEQPQRDFFVLD